MLKRLRETEFADRSSEIRGADLFGTGNEKIGTIEDVIYDSDSSSAAYAIVDTGWLKSRRFIVPSDYIRSRADDPNAFHVPLTRQQIEDLPQFDPDLLNSEERFTEYESRYRPKWKTYGLDMPAARDSRMQRFESRLRDRAEQPGRVAPTTVTGGGVVEGAVSVYAVYHDQSKLEAAVDRLKAAGFDSNDISAVFPDKGRSEQFAMERNTKAPEGAATGGGTGIVVGGVLGWWRASVPWLFPG